MEIDLMLNSSEANKIGKSLSNVATLTGTLREECSIIHPSVLIEYSTPTGFNYCYIPDFNRYYFIDNIIVVRTGLIRIELTVDVLESFKTELLTQPVIIEKNTNNFDLYLPDENLKTLVKTKTDIVNFNSGLLDTGEFILITAGG